MSAQKGAYPSRDSSNRVFRIFRHHASSGIPLLYEPVSDQPSTQCPGALRLKLVILAEFRRAGDVIIAFLVLVHENSVVVATRFFRESFNGQLDRVEPWAKQLEPSGNRAVNT